MQIPWKLTGFVVQSGLVAAVLVVPMLYPEMIAVTLPKIGLVLKAPMKQVVVEQVAATASGPTTTVSSHRMVTRRYVAPTSWDRPVATILDEPGMFAPNVGPGVASADGGGMILTGSIDWSTAAPPAVVVKKPEVKEPEVKRITVGGSVQEARLLKQVKPAYPPLARQARISGEVRLEAVIGVDGTVQQLRAVSGHPLLTGAALEAVRQWRYQATMLNGKPVEVSTVIAVRFLLGGA
jgi:periplasmic protein TonB